jgi:hypothetical protein
MVPGVPGESLIPHKIHGCFTTLAACVFLIGQAALWGGNELYDWAILVRHGQARFAN